MKTFKQFLTEEKHKNMPNVFCNSGGPKQTDKQLDQLEPLEQTPQETLLTKLPAVSCNSGGPREIKESIHVTSNSSVLLDPAADNTTTDPAANDHTRLVKPPTQPGHERTYPHLTDVQARHYQALANNTQHDHPHYRYAVSNYTSGSTELNGHLYRNHVNNKPHDPIVQGIVVKHMDDLIEQHRTPQEMTVYTGPHFNPEEHAGKQVHLPAFTSASLSAHVSKEFGNAGHVLRIYLPKGHPHLFMDPESRFQGQSEVLLPRHMTLQIAKEPSHVVTGEFNDHFDDKHYKDDTVNKVHFWDAHMVKNENI